MIGALPRLLTISNGAGESHTFLALPMDDAARFQYWGFPLWSLEPCFYQ